MKTDFSFLGGLSLLNLLNLRQREAVYYFVNQDTFVNDNSIKKAINSQRTLSLLPALQEDGDYCKTAEVSGFTEPI